MAYANFTDALNQSRRAAQLRGIPFTSRDYSNIISGYMQGATERAAAQRAAALNQQELANDASQLQIQKDYWAENLKQNKDLAEEQAAAQERASGKSMYSNITQTGVGLLGNKLLSGGSLFPSSTATYAGGNALAGASAASEGAGTGAGIMSGTATPVADSFLGTTGAISGSGGALTGSAATGTTTAGGSALGTAAGTAGTETAGAAGGASLSGATAAAGTAAPYAIAGYLAAKYGGQLLEKASGGPTSNKLGARIGRTTQHPFVDPGRAWMDELGWTQDKEGHTTAVGTVMDVLNPVGWVAERLKPKGTWLCTATKNTVGMDEREWMDIVRLRKYSLKEHEKEMLFYLDEGKELVNAIADQVRDINSFYGKFKDLLNEKIFPFIRSREMETAYENYQNVTREYFKKFLPELELPEEA